MKSDFVIFISAQSFKEANEDSEIEREDAELVFSKTRNKNS